MPRVLFQTTYTPEIANAFVCRLSSGRALAAVCRDADMPGRQVVYRWMQRHGEFAAQVAAVRDRGHGGGPGGARPSLYSEARAQGVLAALSEGFSLTEICADPGFAAGYGTVQRWIATRPDFAARYRAACAPRRTPRGLRIGRGRRGGYDPLLADQITERLLEGRSLLSIACDPDMPGTGVMAGWRARRLEFRQAMADARRAQMDVLIDEVLSLRDHPWPGRSRARRLAAVLERRGHLPYAAQAVVGGRCSPAVGEAGARRRRRIGRTVLTSVILRPAGGPSRFRLSAGVGGLRGAPASLRIRAAGSSALRRCAPWPRMTGWGDRPGGRRRRLRLDSTPVILGRA